MTSLYTARMIFIAFFGEMRTEPHDHSGVNMWLPLVILAALAIGGGWFGLAPVAAVLPDGGVDAAHHQGTIVWVTALIPILGVLVGYLIFGGKQLSVQALVESKAGQRIAHFWDGGWGFDTFYDRLVVRPFLFLARINKADAVDFLYTGIAAFARRLNTVTARSQTGQLRWYAANMALGLVLALLLVFLVPGA